MATNLMQEAAEMTFVLANAGHDASIASEPVYIRHPSCEVAIPAGSHVLER